MPPSGRKTRRLITKITRDARSHTSPVFNIQACLSLGIGATVSHRSRVRVLAQQRCRQLPQRRIWAQKSRGYRDMSRGLGVNGWRCTFPIVSAKSRTRQSHRGRGTCDRAFAQHGGKEIRIRQESSRRNAYIRRLILNFRSGGSIRCAGGAMRWGTALARGQPGEHGQGPNKHSGHGLQKRLPSSMGW